MQRTDRATREAPRGLSWAVLCAVALLALFALQDLDPELALQEPALALAHDEPPAVAQAPCVDELPVRAVRLVAFPSRAPPLSRPL